MHDRTAAERDDGDNYTLPPCVYWKLQLRVWAFLGILLLLPYFAPPELPLFKRLLVDYARLGIAAAGSHLIWRITVSRRWLRLGTGKLYARGGLLCLAVAFLVAAALIEPAAALYLPIYRWGLGEQLLSDWAGMSAVMIVWGGLFLGFVHQDRNQHLELQKVRMIASTREAELSALKAQTNPHFLFNSLNTLRSLVGRDPELARTAITQLADVIRFSLTSSARSLVTMREEISLVNSYLSLEKLRFEERLQIHSDVQSGCEGCATPPFVVQTLVENAVKYGTMQQGGVVAISYSVRRDGNRVRVKVANPGSLRSDANSTGIGFRNSRQRLGMLFGSDTAMNLEAAGGQVIASAEWPARPLPR